MPNRDDRREFTRVPAWLTVEIEPPDGRVIRGRARDLGLRGVYVFTEAVLPLGTPCQANLLLGDASDDPRMFAEGRVVRLEKDGIALQFSSIELESFAYLQRFVLYPADDPTDGELELATHAGIMFKAG